MLATWVCPKIIKNLGPWKPLVVLLSGKHWKTTIKQPISEVKNLTHLGPTPAAPSSVSLSRSTCWLSDLLSEWSDGIIWVWVNTYIDTFLVGWTSINPSYDLGFTKFTRYQGFDPSPSSQHSEETKDWHLKKPSFFLGDTLGIHWISGAASLKFHRICCRIGRRKYQQRWPQQGAFHTWHPWKMGEASILIIGYPLVI